MVNNNTTNMKSYITGFIISLVLTIASFGVVYYEVFKGYYSTHIVLMVLAIAQLYVQLKYFLHLDRKLNAGWNMITAVFSIVVVVILFVGSTWIMYNLDYNMSL